MALAVLVLVLGLALALAPVLVLALALAVPVLVLVRLRLAAPSLRVAPFCEQRGRPHAHRLRQTSPICPFRSPVSARHEGRAGGQAGRRAGGQAAGWGGEGGGADGQTSATDAAPQARPPALPLLTVWLRLLGSSQQNTPSCSAWRSRRPRPGFWVREDSAEPGDEGAAQVRGRSRATKRALLRRQTGRQAVGSGRARGSGKQASCSRQWHGAVATWSSSAPCIPPLQLATAFSPRGT